LTIDLSWPHQLVDDKGNLVDSVNGAMRRNEWPANPLLRIAQFAEAAAILQGQGQSRIPKRRVRLWALDCEAFYRQVGRQRAELWHNAIFLPDGVQLDMRECFGDASAATKCARISNFIVFHVRARLAEFDRQHPTREAEWVQWQRERRGAALRAGVVDEREVAERFTALFFTGMYIDDEGGASADDLLYGGDGAAVIGADGAQMRRAAAHFALARETIESFGWKSAKAKEKPPALSLELLGVDITMEDGRMRLGDGKRQRYAEQAGQVALMRSCQREEMQQLLGRLQFAVQCFPRGRLHTQAAWRTMRARFRLAGDAVRVTAEVQADLKWWASELSLAGEHEGVPIAAAAAIPAVGRGAVAIYADASGSIGMSAWAVRGNELLYVVDVWSEVEREALGIAEKELLASTVGLVTLAPLLGNKVYSFSDNGIATAAMRALRAENPRSQELVRRRSEWLLSHRVLEAAERVTSKNNLWADLGSRGEIDEVVRQAEALGMRTRQVPIEAAWRSTADLLAILPTVS